VHNSSASTVWVHNQKPKGLPDMWEQFPCCHTSCTHCVGRIQPQASAGYHTALTSAAQRLLAMAPAAALISPNVPPPAPPKECSRATLSPSRPTPLTIVLNSDCAIRTMCSDMCPGSELDYPTVLCARCCSSALLVLPAALRTPVNIGIVYVLRRDVAQQVRAEAERVADVCKHRHVRPQPRHLRMACACESAAPGGLC
jgi:hypothetical protein